MVIRVNFSNDMVMEERVKNTIFLQPIAYFCIFLYTFIITLCIALLDVKSCFEILLLSAVSIRFFLAGRSATRMRDTFRNRPTQNPITAIAIKTNIKELLK
jgi:ion channel-forming bestrophin family protein